MIKERDIMEFCNNCGAPLKEGAAFCTSCGEPVSRTITEPSPAPQPQPVPAPEPEPEPKKWSTNSGHMHYGSSQPGKQEGLKLAEGEVVVRSYHCASLIQPKAEGYLTVTNKRVFFEGFGGKAWIAQETMLSSISGMNAFNGLDLKPVLIIFGAIVVLFSLTMINDSGTMGLLILLIGAFLILSGIRQCFMLTLTSSGVTGNGISLGSSPTSVLGNGALLTLRSRPTSETDRMLKELGALILDLQTRGDLALKDWQ